MRGVGDESCSVRAHRFEFFYSRFHSRFAPGFAPDSRSTSISLHRTRSRRIAHRFNANIVHGLTPSHSIPIPTDRPFNQRASCFIAPHPIIFVVAIGNGRPAITYEAHRSRQFPCHSRRLSLSGTLATASASSFLLELCVGSPLPVREPTSFQQRRKQDGYQQQTREYAALRQHQSHDLAE